MRRSASPASALVTQLVPALRSMDLVKAGVEGWWGDITHMVKLATGEVTYGDYSVGVPANLGAESCAVLATYWVTFAIFLYFVDKYVLPPFSRFMVGDELSKDSEGGKTGTPLRVKYSIAVRELAFSRSAPPFTSGCMPFAISGRGHQGSTCCTSTVTTFWWSARCGSQRSSRRRGTW